jgi:glycosyltransferase involved in cell wall biosynthesis
VKVLHLVSVANAQSVPLELALAMRKRVPDTIVAAFGADGDHPSDHDADSVVCLDACGPFDLAAIARLRGLLARERPDILHLHHAVSAFWGGLVARTIRPAPLLVKTEHNDHRAQRPYQAVINAMLYPRLRAIVCNSDTTLASFSAVERLLAGDRALRIYNGLDLGRVRDRASRVRTGDGTVRIGHVGRLVEQKNQARMIEGLARARAVTGLDLRLEIVGGGPLLPDLQATARRAGVADFVEFAGAVTRGGVYERLARWDAFVMPSKFEGFCNALVEAMAAGLPIAVSDIDTLREVAGAGALRFDPADAASIGEAFARLARMDRSRDRFVERYDMTRAVDRHVALYRRLLAGLHPVAPGPLLGPESA